MFELCSKLTVTTPERQQQQWQQQNIVWILFKVNNKEARKISVKFGSFNG